MREIQHATIDSTILDARRRLLSGERLPFQIVADKQTAGRGTNGRQWSNPEGNLYISWAYSLPRKAADPKVFMFSLWQRLSALVCRVTMRPSR